MALIVGVHGIAQQYRGRFELEGAWGTALRDGLLTAGHPRIAHELRSEDFRVAFFGDLFRPPGAMSAGGPAFTYRDVEAGAQRDLLEAFYRRAIELEPGLAPPAGSMGPGRVAVKMVVDRLLRSRVFAGVTERILVGNVVQAMSFLGDPNVKARVLGRLGEAIGPETRVLIGHSLGSIVAYEYLCTAGVEPSIELFVSMGSPLGIPSLVFERLTPTPVGGVGVWPGSVARWVNVSDVDDFVALRPALGDRFASAATAGVGVEDRLVDNGDQPHAVQRYLNAKETGSVVGALLDS